MRFRFPLRIRSFLASIAPLVLGLSACMEPAPMPTTTAVVAVDDDAILSTLATFRTSPAFQKVNDTTFATGLGTGALIDVYVSQNGFAPYATIAPEATGTGAEVPEGTLIVREVKEPSGATKSLTLMYKGPKGYNPELDDFWFGVTDPDGVPVQQDGVARIGKLTDCYSCHLGRAQDGYLFGVAADNRPGLTPPPVEPPPPPPPPPPPTTAPLCGDFICNGIESCALCGFDCGICPPVGDDHGGGGGDDHGGGDH
jgi:hypothetical protein